MAGEAQAGAAGAASAVDAAAGVKPDAGAAAATALGVAPAADAKGALGEVAKPDAGAAAELKFTLPEGLDAKDPFITSSVKTAKGLAKDLGLNEKQANGVLSAYLKATEGERKSVADYNAEQKAWAEELQKDPKVGAKFDGPVVQDARSALSKFPEGRAAHEALVKMGLTNNPAVVRYLAAVGASLKEDTIRGSTGPGPAQQKARGDILAGIYNKTDLNRPS